MKTAVGSSILFDIVKGAPGAMAAQKALEAALAHGSLSVCAVVVAELGRSCPDDKDLREFLAACQIDHDPLTLEAALDAAYALQQADALLTTDAGFYRHYFDDLRVVMP